MKDVLINEDDVEQIEWVRKFLTAFRNEFSKYGETALKHQACSNVISLLAEHKRGLNK